MQSGLRFTYSAHTVDQLKALDPKTLTEEQKMILSIAYDLKAEKSFPFFETIPLLFAYRSDEESRAANRARGSRHQRSARDRSPPRNNRGETPKGWERRHRR